MSENKNKVFRLRLTPEQKQIVLEHPFAAENIRQFINRKIQNNEPCNEKLDCEYQIKMTPTMKQNMEYMTNISHHVRLFIDDVLKYEIKE